MKVANVFGHPLDTRKWSKSKDISCNDTFVGVEIELENLRRFSINRYDESLTETGYWVVTDDGSLRNNGLEFIMTTPGNQPLKGGDVVEALDIFDHVMTEYIGDGNEPPDCSERTSVHIHVDVRDLDINEMKKFILFYSIFEKIFFQWNNPTRYHNNYCRSIDLHRDIIHRLSDLISASSPKDLYYKVNKGFKYDALNYLSTSQRGSIEFRLMHGTYDTEKILKWINMLLCLKIAAKDPEIDINNFPETMSIRGTDKLIDIIFGKYGEELKEYADQFQILEGVRIAQEILLSRKFVELDELFSKHSPKSSSHLSDFASKNLQQEIK